MRKLPCGADLLRVSLTGPDVTELFEVVEARMAASSPDPLVIIEDSDVVAEDVEGRVEVASSLSDVTLATSGTSGVRSSLVGLSWEALTHSAGETNRYLTPDLWLLPLPPHHIAGFQIVVRSVLLGSPPAVASSTDHLRQLVKEVSPGTVTSLVPTQLRDLAGTPLENFHAILVGGARLPKQLLGASSHLPLVTSYGMTETCGGCVYDGRPLPGTEIRIQDGRVLISGPTLMDGYVDAANPFVEYGGRRYLATNDAGIWDGGLLSVQGRLDQVIISGGENLSPPAIEDAIFSELPNLQVAVLGVPDQRWGEVVCAAVVVSGENLNSTATRIREIVRDRLGAKAAPRRIVCVPRLPLFPTGKIDLQTLREQVLEAVRDKKAWSAD